MNPSDSPDKRSIWLSFAAYVMALAGFFQALVGLIALYRPDVFMTSSRHLLVSDYHRWGWWHLIVGILLLLTAFPLYRGRLWSRIAAVVWAVFSALINFGSIALSPLWSIAILTLDVLLIYGIVMYGGSRQL